MKFPTFHWMLAAFLSVAICGVLSAQDDDAADEDSATAEAAENVANGDNEDANPSYVFRMSNNKFITGVPVDLPSIDVYILGTKVPVPTDAIMGIRFAATDEGKASIALKNGEVYSGTVEMPEVRLAVEWGEAKIKRGMLRSMVKTNDLFWQLKDTPAGARWFLAPKSGSYQSSKLFRDSQDESAAMAPVITNQFVQG